MEHNVQKHGLVNLATAAVVFAAAAGAGENTGRTLPIKNVVKSLTRLGDWRGQAVRFVLPPASPDLATAVLVQTKGLGPILAAARG